ncbi:sugar ABC transporter permease [Labrys sp. ZIDIC5]|uniref:carbohydrate ABC transporter permease n=1 Tax=Labrys sedimenti TaxID=3106036 RepID=UPI002ACA5469|nr:sugar ABC transporter permease [Labrys sp. ZIDIC5]MDZ5452632.1 sugar ABC transporter permease [Labrys sp. ZIDIC5]
MLDASKSRNLLYILPSLLIYGAFVLVPILSSIVLGFTAWDGISAPRFVGLENYAALFSDPVFYVALKNNLVLLIFYVALPLLLGLAMAAIVTSIHSREQLILRTLYFMPYVMPTAVLGIIWRWLYNPAFGPLNQALKAIGLKSLALPWLGSFTFALPAVGLVANWYYAGFCMAIFMSGLQRVEPSLYDAAKVDGASPLQSFRHISVPSLLPEVRIVLLLTIIFSIKNFDLVFTMTRGAPANATLVPNLYMYQLGFDLGRYGYASAVAVIGAILIFMVNGAIHRFMPERERER